MDESLDGKADSWNRQIAGGSVLTEPVAGGGASGNDDVVGVQNDVTQGRNRSNTETKLSWQSLLIDREPETPDTVEESKDADLVREPAESETIQNGALSPGGGAAAKGGGTDGDSSENGVARKSENMPRPQSEDDTPETWTGADSLLLDAATMEDTDIVLDLLANVAGADLGTFAVVALGQPQNGTATLNLDGTVVYVPHGDFSGTDSFSYTVADGTGTTAQATIEVSVAAVADEPTLEAPASLSATAGEAVLFEIAAMVTDLDGSETLTVIVENLPQGATLSAGLLQNDGSWALSGGELEGLQLFLSNDVVGSHNILVTAHSAESSNGDTASVSSDVALTVDPVVTTSDPNPDQGQSDVVGVTLVNTTASQSQDGFLTFGHVFAEGDLSPDSGLVARVNGVDIPIQVDVKATHADGSVRHAILTMQAPSLAPGAEADIMLVKTAPPTVTALDPTAILQTYDLQLKLVVDELDGTQSTHVVDVASLIAEAFSAGNVEHWLSGPMTTEFSVSAQIDELLDARFDVRVYADGTVRTDVIVSNDNTYGSVAPRTVVYDVEIIQGGATQFSATDVSHHRNSNWHKEIWAGDGPADAHLQYDQAYLVATGAIPAIDYSLGITEQALADSFAALQAADNGILGPSLVKQHMPGTGGRADIGPLTGWASKYFVSQDERAQEVMLAQADAAGSIPWHFQDVVTGEWVDIDSHPLVRTGGQGGSGVDQLPAFSDSGGWTPDTAHQPSLSFLPYLVTGSQYYADELAAQAAYSLTIYDWGREEDTGLLEKHELRGMAWAMRSLSEAAYALPDDYALKDYFAAKLQNNLDHLITKYIENGYYADAGEVEGWFSFWVGHNPGINAPWQQDFMSVSLALAYQRGFESAGELLEWTENFTAGRYLNGDNGFDPNFGSAAFINTFSYDSGTGTITPYSTWAQVFDNTWLGDTEGIKGYPTDSNSYWLNAQSALAGHITVNASPMAIEAYGIVSSITQDYAYWDINNYSNVYTNPTWLIAPILPDGTHLTRDRVVFGSGEFAGGEGSQMLIGDDAANVIHGGAGIDLVFGIGGNNVLHGKAGNDYMFGGPGSDRLIGGEGDDYLKGGNGADTFVFDTNGTGLDVIADWDPGSDLLEIHQGINGMTEASSEELLGRISDDGAGNAVVDLGAGNTVTLLGVEAADITASHLELVF